MIIHKYTSISNLDIFIKIKEKCVLGTKKIFCYWRHNSVKTTKRQNYVNNILNQFFSFDSKFNKRSWRCITYILWFWHLITKRRRKWEECYWRLNSNYFSTSLWSSLSGFSVEKSTNIPSQWNLLERAHRRRSTRIYPPKISKWPKHTNKHRIRMLFQLHQHTSTTLRAPLFTSSLNSRLLHKRQHARLRLCSIIQFSRKYHKKPSKKWFFSVILRFSRYHIMLVFCHFSLLVHH